MLYLNLFRGDPRPLLEESPQGGASEPVALDGRAEACLRALLALGSFEVSHSLGALFAAGAASARARPGKAGGRKGRR